MTSEDSMRIARETLAVSKAEPLTSVRVKHLAGKALHNPKEMSLDEIKELAGSVLRHIRRNP